MGYHTGILFVSHGYFICITCVSHEWVHQSQIISLQSCPVQIPVQSMSFFKSGSGNCLCLVLSRLSICLHRLYLHFARLKGGSFLSNQITLFSQNNNTIVNRLGAPGETLMDGLVSPGTHYMLLSPISPKMCITHMSPLCL